jgi:glucokinase
MSEPTKALTMDARRMRRHNAEHVLRVVRELGPISRSEIARHTKLSAPTVAALVGDLVRAEVVEEFGEGESTGGRRPQLVSFNARFGVVIGANIGATSVRLGLADMSGEWIARQVVPLPEDTRPKSLLGVVARAARGMCAEHLGGASRLRAMVVGAPGMTDMARGVVLEAANLDGWVDVPARDLLQAQLSVPIVVDNDVNLAAVGEHWRGAGRGLRDFVFVMMGTGIGAGIVIDGKVHRGNRWHAGEIGHLNVDYREWDADFGASGYLETYLGSTPQTERARAPRRHRGALDDAGLARLGAAVANVATVVDPEAIIFGGRVALAQPDVLGRVQSVATRIAPNCPKIGLTELGEDAPLFGSVRLALNYVDEWLPDYLAESA